MTEIYRWSLFLAETCRSIAVISESPEYRLWPNARITIRDDVVELRALELSCLDGMLGGLGRRPGAGTWAPIVYQ